MPICVNLWSIKTICGLTSFVHRLSQIYTDFLISKDIVIITDFLFGTEIHGFFKRHGLAPHCINHSTLWLRLASQVHGLVTFFNISFLEPCLYFSIALMQIKPFPSRSQPCLFKSRVHPCLKIPHSSHVLFPHVSDFLFYSLKISGATSEIPTLLYYLCIRNKITGFVPTPS